MALKRSFMVKAICFLSAAVLLAGSVGCTTAINKNAGNSKTIVFADADWDSIKFHNNVAKLILENGYGYKTDEKTGTTAITFSALRKGDINVYMEVWTDNLNFYGEAIKSGDILELSTNFDDNAQGLYVPTYVIKGDSKRGIKAMAPDLKSVKDLPKYKELFKDPEEPGKGRIYGAISGWQVDELLFKKFNAYNFDKTFTYMRPGSEAALSASISSAYEKGLPWVGYYWEPTWIMGKYDMTLLKDDPYTTKEDLEKGLGAFPSNKVTICVDKGTAKDSPQVVEFLKKYKTSSQITSEALAYMIDNKATHTDTAIWFLKNREDVWGKWVPDDIKAKIKASIK